MNNEVKIFASAAVIIVVVVGLLFFLEKFQPVSPTASTSVVDSNVLVHDNSHKMGSNNKVTIVEFGDYQCPACGAAYPVTKKIMAEYGDKIMFVFRNYPLPQHQFAKAAANVAEAAGAQGKFWEMHDVLYEKQMEWSLASDPTANFTQYAKDLGLDADKVMQVAQGNQYTTDINNDIVDGNTAGVNATPTFYVNGHKMADYDYETLKKAIEEELSSQ